MPLSLFFFLQGIHSCVVDLDSRAEGGVDESSQAGKDLASFDFNTWKFLQFKDTKGQHYDAAVFDSIELYYTTTLSDGKTRVDLIPNGRNIRVRFEDRHLYAKLVARARFSESALQLQAIRGIQIRCLVLLGLFSFRIFLISCVDGLSSVLGLLPLSGGMASPLAMFRWIEFELRVCGLQEIDIETLKQHTTYTPAKYKDVRSFVIRLIATAPTCSVSLILALVCLFLQSQIVQDFWAVLESFTPAQRSQFLQFAWARSKLPDDSSDKSKPLDQKSYRMQLEIEDSVNQAVLDTRLPRA